MKRTNVACWDGGLRIVAGAAVISFALVGPKSPWGWLGFVPLISGLARYCPLYHLFGFSTAREGDEAGPPC